MTRVGMLLGLLLLVDPTSAGSQTYMCVTGAGPFGTACVSGVKSLDLSNQPVPTDGSCPGCSVITKAQYDAYNSAIQAPFSVNARLQAGLAVTFTLSSASSGTYAADQQSIAELQAVLLRFSAIGNFPGATALTSVKDTAGVTHSMNALAFKALFVALQDYAASVQAAANAAIIGNVVPVWPVAAQSIAQ